ncbi:DUF222 domain-containing protein [Auritidibacter ignavus]|uniref:DUF222 domain-containing protein n=1 Tax=Auritidibacter ignavus TaxID=678932 RepID=A0AAJ6AGB7_9MICC|nr:HNH endonuclease signature motif containing protein [Auritidibacter ignavus]WGH92212.1 DUF222 domain-containing protein [Auritidibacter ignavus]
MTAQFPPPTQPAHPVQPDHSAPADQDTVTPAAELLDAFHNTGDQLRDQLVTLSLTDQADAIDLLAAAEDLTRTLDGIKATLTAQLSTLRIEAETADNIPALRRGSGLGAEIALARRVDHRTGAKLLRAARTLADSLPQALASMTNGGLSEAAALTLVRDTQGVDADHRRTIDQHLAGDYATLTPAELGQRAQAHAQRLDPETMDRQASTNRTKRNVKTGPAGPGMGTLNAYLPAEQAAACHATLQRDARRMIRTGEDTRSEEQLIADLLVERLTGQSSAPAIPVQVKLVMTDRTLFGTDDTVARIPGVGTLPAYIARQWVANPEANVLLNRLFTAPQTGHLVAMESSARLFPPGLKELIRLRDDLCRTPGCENPIHELDHATRFADGGPTSFANGQGLCRVCNQTKEKKHWKHHSTVADMTVETPTGHRYRRPTPPVLPGLDLSDPEPPDPDPPAPDPPAPDTLIPLEAIEHGPDDVPDPFSTDGPPPF